MQAKDYYRILGVAETASAQELKKAFRKIAQESHPDTHPGDKAAEERFKEASEAYDVLGDPEKRQKYDALRRYGFGEGRGGAQGMEDLFRGFPGGGRMRTQTGNWEEVDFADLFDPDSPFAGVFEQLFEQMGVGPTPGRRRSRVRVRRSRTPGNGADASGEDDPFFRRDGIDAHCTVWLKLEHLERGAKVKVRTPSGKKAIVRIPPKTAIGSVLRLPGMGYAQGNRRGDQYVHVEAVA